MRSKTIRLAALVVVAISVLLLFGLRTTSHKISLKAYFTNAAGLRDGAAVRVAGVDVGTVKSVRVRPELKEEPVEVVMVLNPAYEIKIPNDSVVSLETAGVLGSTYVEIDAARATGPPIGNNAVLKSRPTAQMNTEQFFESVSKILDKQKCDCGKVEQSTQGSTAASKSSSNAKQRQ